MATHSRLIRWAVLGGGLLILAVLFLQLGPALILSLFNAIGWNLPVIIGIFAIHECVRALAVQRCLPDGAPPFRVLLKVRFLGEGLRALTYTGPFLSEPARAWLLAKEGLRGTHAAGGTAAELIANSCASALVAVGALAYLLATPAVPAPLRVLAHILLWSSLGYVVAAALALGRRWYLIGAVMRGVGSLPGVGRRIRVDPVHLREMEDVIFHVLRDHPATLADVMLLELTAQALLVFDLFWTLRSMDIPIAYGSALIVESLTKLANVVQFVGVAEGAYAVVLDWLGMTAAAGFTLAIVKRLRSLGVGALGVTLFSSAVRAPAPRNRARAML